MQLNKPFTNPSFTVQKEFIFLIVQQIIHLEPLLFHLLPDESVEHLLLSNNKIISKTHQGGFKEKLNDLLYSTSPGGATVPNSR